MRAIRNILVAALAITALAAAAGAQAAEFTTSEEGEEVETELIESHVFSVTGANLECAVIGLQGQLQAGPTMTLQPTYANCEFAGFAATVDTKGCSLTFKAATSGSEHATLNLSGCTNGGITITVNNVFAKCTVFIKNQSIENAVHYVSTEGSLDVFFTASTIHAEVTTSDGLCPINKGTHANAVYFGASQLRGSLGSETGYEP
jgi:hypothetical protein